MGTPRIRFRKYKGFDVELWQVYSVHGKARKVDNTYYDRDTYNYKVTTPTDVKFAGRVFQPQPENYGDTRKIVDDFLVWLFVTKPKEEGITKANYQGPGQLEWFESREYLDFVNDLWQPEKLSN